MSSEESSRERAPKRGRSRRPGIADVAKLAGVSTTTVSYVLNDTPPYASQFSEDTRSRVFKAAEELNYRPNIYAAGLRNRTSILYGVYLGETEPSHPMWPPQIVSLLFGLSKFSSKLSMLPVVRVERPADADEERSLLRHLIRAGVQGILTAYPSETVIQEMQALRRKRFPFLVLFGNRCEGKFENWMDVDNVEFVRLMARTLLEKGHRRVVCLAGDLDRLHAAHRLQGFREVMSDAGLPLTEDQMLSHPTQGYSESEGTQFENQTRDLIDQQKPTAVACLTSGATMFGWTALRDLNLKAPEQISFIGAETDFSQIPDVLDIQSVSCDWEEMGRKGVEFLHSLIVEESTQPLPYLTAPRLVPGITVGPPASPSA